MDGIMLSILGFILTVEFIIGYLANGFIALVNFMDCVRRRKISLVDQILSALAVSRIALLLSILTNVLAHKLYWGALFTGKVLIMSTFPWVVANHFCMWLPSCLGLFYFLKIARFSNSVLVYLRQRVERVVSVILLLSLFLLVLEIVLINPFFDVMGAGYEENLANTSSLNNSDIYRFILILHCVFISFPFTVSQSTFLLLIFSLLKHLKKMQDNIQGCRDISTTAHVTALKIMVTSVLLCTIFFLGFLLQVWKSELLKNDLYVRFCQIAAVTFLSVHSCVLILGNTKLRQALTSVLWWLQCRTKDV